MVHTNHYFRLFSLFQWLQLINYWQIYSTMYNKFTGLHRRFRIHVKTRFMFKRIHVFKPLIFHHFRFSLKIYRNCWILLRKNQLNKITHYHQPHQSDNYLWTASLRISHFLASVIFLISRSFWFIKLIEIHWITENSQSLVAGQLVITVAESPVESFNCLRRLKFIGRWCNKYRLNTNHGHQPLCACSMLPATMLRQQVACQTFRIKQLQISSPVKNRGGRMLLRFHQIKL